ncbi:MAG: hypothetical protein ACRDFX_13900, partial [Chloroflexota bacterium]
MGDILVDFRRRRGWLTNREIKFTDLDRERRLELLTAIATSEARASAVVIDKRSIKTPVQQLKPGALYK